MLGYTSSVWISATWCTAVSVLAQSSSDLARFRVDAKNSPVPAAVAPVETELPLVISKNASVVFIGNTLFDRAQYIGVFEGMLHRAFPEHRLRVRSLAWSADEIDLMPRPANFGSLHQHLLAQKADVIFAAFGFNESFAGQSAVSRFKTRLADFLQKLRTRAFNTKTGARIVLVSPIANEDVRGVEAGSRNNANLALYTAAMKAVAVEQRVGFVNVFAPTFAKMAAADKSVPLTFNGVHLLTNGYRVFARGLFRGTFGREAPAVDEALRTTILDKNRQFHYRYRHLNSFYYVGGRKGPYGRNDFFPAMRRFDVMLSNRDRRIWAIAAGTKVPDAIDDSNAPPMPEAQRRRGANRYMSPADELKAFKIDPRFEVNCFASEEDFPDLACPVQMRWDARGRLWVSCTTTYPHVYPGNAARDKIIILEDTDRDGRADKCSVFADDLHIPLSFEFGDGGLYVSEPPHLVFLADRDGDGRADFRRKVLTGFGTEDSHHSLHDIVWSPDGDLIARDSIFLHSQVETPYGPVRLFDSGWFRFRPSTHKLMAFGMYRSTNPWGVTFDDWGQHVASHPIFASAFHATNPPYPELQPRPSGIPAYSGTCGQEFIDMASFPDDMQGGFVKVRYKPSNRVEIHKWLEQGDHYAEKYTGDILFSSNLSFIPVDVRFGPRGALYVLDWYNPVKGHSQYSLRDARRDRKSGRVWRITAKGRPLVTPPKIAGVGLADLLHILERREYRYRYWAKREIRGRDRVAAHRALEKWLAGLRKTDPRFRHHQVEAMWMYRNLERTNGGLLRGLIGCEEHHARAAATRQLRYWHGSMPDAIELLGKAATDPNGLVRLEAAIAASYIGSAAAFRQALKVMDKPRGAHLDYALACALGSEALRRHWQGKPEFAAVPAFLGNIGKKRKLRGGRSNASAARFDRLRNLKLVKIGCVPEKMRFTVERFVVRPNQPVKLVLENADATDHNLVICRPGSSLRVGMAAAEMARDPKNAQSDFVPVKTKRDILQASKMIGPMRKIQIDVLRFRAPRKPGVYPYICTFPGHFAIMKGEMVVRRKPKKAPGKRGR